MKYTKIFLIIIFAIVLVITLYFNFFSESSLEETNTTAPIPTTVTPSYTLAQVITHSGRSSCWTIIKNNVYDLTLWIEKHPGGAENILKICGKDGTVAFEGQHGGQSQPEKVLASFFIGTYKKQ